MLQHAQASCDLRPLLETPGSVNLHYVSLGRICERKSILRQAWEESCITRDKAKLAVTRDWDKHSMCFIADLTCRVILADAEMSPRILQH